ncbi:unnamed protein product, partial [Iphiclides podalirius]
MRAQTDTDIMKVVAKRPSTNFAVLPWQPITIYSGNGRQLAEREQARLISIYTRAPLHTPRVQGRIVRSPNRSQFNGVPGDFMLIIPKGRCEGRLSAPTRELLAIKDSRAASAARFVFQAAAWAEGLGHALPDATPSRAVFASTLSYYSFAGDLAGPGAIAFRWHATVRTTRSENFPRYRVSYFAFVASAHLRRVATSTLR